MAESNLPDFDSLKELADFFDANDMGDYWQNLPEVTFDVAITRKTRLVAIEEALAERVAQAAKERSISPEMLIEAWLEEKLALAD